LHETYRCLKLRTFYIPALPSASLAALPLSPPHCSYGSSCWLHAVHQHAAFCLLAHFLLNLQTISFSDTSIFCFDSDVLQRAFDVANQILNEYHLSKTIYYKKIALRSRLCDTGPTTEVELF
jgi:hypothetical protein